MRTLKYLVEQSDAKASRSLIKIRESEYDDASSIFYLGIITVLPLFAIKVIEAIVHF